MLVPRRVRKLKHGTRWGDWWLDAETPSLVLDYGREGRYAVPLDEMVDSAHMLDWIFQLRIKTWVTNDVMGDLLTAFQDLFCPQDFLCRARLDRKLDAASHLSERITK